MNQREKRYYYLVISALSLTGLSVLLAGLIVFAVKNPAYFKVEAEPVMAESTVTTPSENGETDPATAFVAEGDFMLVQATCTSCHSAKLVTQNRATRDGWEEMIRWMQRTQKLWDLGKDEDKILDYLAQYYGPEKKGRRSNLVVEEWYEISQSD